MLRALSKFLPSTVRAPEVTRQRMYLETMQQVYSNTSKVMVDAKGQGNLLYLPLDKLMQVTAPLVVSDTNTAPAGHCSIH